MGFFDKLRKNRERIRERIKKLENKKGAKHWSMSNITRKKREARKRALEEIRYHGITKDLFDYLDQYYENDFSEFGEFSIGYKLVYGYDTYEKGKTKNDRLEALLKNSRNNSQFLAKLARNWKYYRDEFIPLIKKVEKLAKNDYNFETQFNYLAIYIMNKFKAEDPYQLLPNLVEKVLEWKNNAESLLTNYENQCRMQFDNHECAVDRLRCWWEWMDPKKWGSVYDVFCTNTLDKFAEFLNNAKNYITAGNIDSLTRLAKAYLE